MSNIESENLTNQDEDHDDDDDELNSSHKIVPNINQSSASKINEPNVESLQSKNNNFDVQNLIKQDSKKFVNTSIPKDYSGFVHCHIKRDKQGIQKGFLTMFSLYLDNQNQNDQICLLIARKHLTIGGHSEYFIGNDHETLLKNANDENSMAKVRGINIAGTDYIVYDHQNQQLKQQLAAVIYEGHIFSTVGPRKLSVILPNTEKGIQSSRENETIIDQWKSGRSSDFIELKNKSPKFDEESKRYVLNFHENRVQQPSHKNFQLISENENHEENIAMQFGRIDENTFALDYRYPLSAIQAFAIALSSFHNRFRT